MSPYAFKFTYSQQIITEKHNAFVILRFEGNRNRVRELLGHMTSILTLSQLLRFGTYLL